MTDQEYLSHNTLIKYLEHDMKVKMGTMALLSFREVWSKLLTRDIFCLTFSQHRKLYNMNMLQVMSSNLLRIMCNACS